MARTISEIYDSLNASKSSFDELNAYIVDSQVPSSTEDTAANLALDVTSGSKVAAWRLIFWIVAKASWVLEVMFDRLVAQIKAILAAERPHTLPWYGEESKKFQYGYAMTWLNNKYSYTIDDPDARIVKYANASEKNGRVTLKVAKDSGGTKAPLSILEKTALTEFWSKWKDAGVRLEIISQPADILKVHAIIVRDRLVLDGNNNLLRDNTINPIDNAFQAFGQGLEFDGILRLSHLVDAIQAAEGVIDIKLTGAWHKPSGGTYSPVDISVESVAGYFELNANDSVFTYNDNVEVTVFD